MGPFVTESSCHNFVQEKVNVLNSQCGCLWSSASSSVTNWGKWGLAAGSSMLVEGAS